MQAPIIVQVTFPPGVTRLLKAGEVADLLSCSLQHIFDLVAERKLVAFNFASTNTSQELIRIHPTSLERFLEASAV